MNVAETDKILLRLNGRKGIVLGNHDRGAAWYLARGFDFALNEIAFKLEGYSVRACHFPPLPQGDVPAFDSRYPDRRPTLREGEILIHGHTHDTLRRRGRHIHVGVDAWDYRPASAGEVLRLMKEADE